MRLSLITPTAQLIGQRGHLFPWSPVFLALGVAFYFSLTWEPQPWQLGLSAVLGLISLVLWRRLGPLTLAVGLVCLGLALAGGRAHMVAGPVLDWRYYGAIEGRVIGIDRSSSDALRLTLDQVVLERMAPMQTPRRVRISLHGPQGDAPRAGAVLITTGYLTPPGGAVEPGGFDFQRHAWFLGLGAVGYTRVPVLTLETPDKGLRLLRARMWLSNRVQSQLPEQTGAFAAAIMTGERSGLRRETLAILRETNLAHLIAISGLHMGLLVSFVFAALRMGLLMLPSTRHAGRASLWAALGALIAAAGYLALSGGAVPTQRAFVMAAVGLAALMLGRRVLSLRAVALAALIVLVLRPEALLSPGFQMSFAATTALVTVFRLAAEPMRALPRWAGSIVSVALSSAVAGAATGPVAMAHFNMMAVYGFVANVISVPVMGLIVVPSGVLAMLLMPFGLDWIGLWLMGFGLEWILGVAQVVSSWEGAVRPIVAPAPWVLPMMAFGALILCLWRGAGRYAGFGPMGLALIGWLASERPDILIAQSGTLVGVMTEQGRALSRESGSGFIAGTWLENDGNGLSQKQAARLWPGHNAGRRAHAELGAWALWHIQGKRAAEGFGTCKAEQIIIASTDLTLEGDCLSFDPKTLRKSGSVAIYLDQIPPRIVSDASLRGQRLWHPER